MGKRPKEEEFARAASIARESVKTISNLRASAEYRSHLIEVLTHRLLSQAWAQI